MTQHESIVYLRHILKAIDQIEQYLEGMTRDDLLADSKCGDAVVRQLEIIGEASSNVPQEIRERMGQVPWQDIIDMRNKLIHEYFATDVDIVWSTSIEDLPPLKVAIKTYIESL